VETSGSAELRRKPNPKRVLGAVELEDLNPCSSASSWSARKSCGTRAAQEGLHRAEHSHHNEQLTYILEAR